MYEKLYFLFYNYLKNKIVFVMVRRFKKRLNKRSFKRRTFGKRRFRASKPSFRRKRV